MLMQLTNIILGQGNRGAAIEHRTNTIPAASVSAGTSIQRQPRVT
jgi:hypothetical protein